MERLPFRATAGSAGYADLRLPVAILLENVRSMYNVGSFFRTGDGAGVERIFLSGITARPPNRGIQKTALGAEMEVPWSGIDDADGLVNGLREQGYEIAAVETNEHALDLFDWRPAFPVCVLFGNEVEGLSAPLLAVCDTFVRLPMLGTKHSLNVANAGAVVMYELLRKYRELTRIVS